MGQLLGLIVPHTPCSVHSPDPPPKNFPSLLSTSLDPWSSRLVCVCPCVSNSVLLQPFSLSLGDVFERKKDGCLNVRQSLNELFFIVEDTV